MKAKLSLYVMLFLAFAGSSAAQNALEQYELGGTTYDLHGYYASADPKNLHFLAVFGETDKQKLDPATFDFEAACTAVNAGPPVHPSIPKTDTEFQHGVVFVKTIEKRLFGLASFNMLQFTEFDIVDGVCVKTQTPGKIYIPRPGFVP